MYMYINSCGSHAIIAIAFSYVQSQKGIEDHTGIETFAKEPKEAKVLWTLA